MTPDFKSPYQRITAQGIIRRWSQTTHRNTRQQNGAARFVIGSIPEKGGLKGEVTAPFCVYTSIPCMNRERPRTAKDLPSDVERYVDEGIAGGMPEDKAWAVAWSRYCEYKNPGSDHCQQDEYFPGKKTAQEFPTQKALNQYLKDHPDADKSNHSVKPKSKVDYPDYERDVSSKSVSLSKDSESALTALSGARKKIENGNGTPALEKKVKSSHAAIVSSAEKSLSHAQKILSSYDTKTLSPQAAMRVQTLGSYLKSLGTKISESKSLGDDSAKLAKDAESLHGALHNVNALVTNLNERSTKKAFSAERVAYQHLAAMGTKIPSGTRRDINSDLIRVGMDGNKRFERMSSVLNVAGTVLMAYGIEWGTVINSHQVSQPNGRINIDLAFTNSEDLFSPTDITNSVLAIHWTQLANGLEVVAYLS